MAKKPELIEEADSVEITSESRKASSVETVEKRVVLMNTQNYSIFVPYFKDECLVPPRARVQLLENGLQETLPEGIYKLGE